MVCRCCETVFNYWNTHTLLACVSACKDTVSNIINLRYHAVQTVQDSFVFLNCNEI